MRLYLHNLITSQRPHLWVPEHWGLGFDVNLGRGHKHSVYCIAHKDTPTKIKNKIYKEMGLKEKKLGVGSAHKHFPKDAVHSLEVSY